MRELINYFGHWCYITFVRSESRTVVRSEIKGPMSALRSEIKFDIMFVIDELELNYCCFPLLQHKFSFW